MKINQKLVNLIQRAGLGLSIFLLSRSVFAKDLLETALQGDVQDTLGSDARFWKICILVSIVLATAAAIPTRSPMVFFGVATIAFIPPALIKMFVF